MDYEIVTNVDEPKPPKSRGSYNYTRIWTAIRNARWDEWIVVKGLPFKAITAFRSLASVQTRRRYGDEVALDIRVRCQRDGSYWMYICKVKESEDAARNEPIQRYG
jgi:hypothetical protein